MKNPTWKRVTTRQLPIVLASISLLSMVPAADDLCGATVVENLRLDHDLTCSGNGLTIGADGITVDLYGHTIEGSSTGIGILVAGHTTIRISGGTIRNFQTGVQVSNSSGVLISENRILNNTMDGIDLQAGSIDTTVKENEVRDNVARGVMLRGNNIRSTVKENTFVGNRVGILLFGPVDAVIKENYASDSVLAGIRINVLATRNLIKENYLASNPAGIEFLVTPTGSARGNSLIENTVEANACGLKGPTAGNTLKENLFLGNGADTCS